MKTLKFAHRENAAVCPCDDCERRTMFAFVAEIVILIAMLIALGLMWWNLRGAA